MSTGEAIENEIGPRSAQRLGAIAQRVGQARTTESQRRAAGIEARKIAQRIEQLVLAAGITSSGPSTRLAPPGDNKRACLPGTDACVEWHYRVGVKSVAAARVAVEARSERKQWGERTATVAGRLAVHIAMDGDRVVLALEGPYTGDALGESAAGDAPQRENEWLDTAPDTTPPPGTMVMESANDDHLSAAMCAILEAFVDEALSPSA